MTIEGLFRHAIGDMVDRYLVVRVLGGSATPLLEVLHLDTELEGTLQWLPAPLAADAERLREELRCLERIRHRNVAAILAVGEHRGRGYLVMERLRGELLQSRFERGPLAVQEACGLMHAVMHGVAEAHAQGVLHGDLKPTSVFLATSLAERTATPKVLDFLTAKQAIDAARRRTNTLHTTTFSDYEYMAYEQLHMDPEVDGRADVYALGVMLYRALTGHFPYRAQNPVDLALEMAHGSHVPLTKRDPSFLSDLEAVVARALTCDREERYPTVGAFAAALAPYALGANGGARPSDPSTSARSRRQWVKARLPQVVGPSQSGWIAKLSPWSRR